MIDQFLGDSSVQQPNCDNKLMPRWFTVSLTTQQQTCSFVSALMDLLLTGEDQSQADQPNSLADGPSLWKWKSNLILFIVVLSDRRVV